MILNNLYLFLIFYYFNKLKKLFHLIYQITIISYLGKKKNDFQTAWITSRGKEAFLIFLQVLPK